MCIRDSNENGEILDIASSLETVGEAPNGPNLDYFGFRADGETDDGFIVVNLSDDPFENITLSAQVSAEDLGKDLVDATDVQATPYREFNVPVVTFIEPDNVVDMTYILTIKLLDGLGNPVGSTSRFVVGSEAALVPDTVEAPLDKVSSSFAILEQNEDGETFKLLIGLEGSAARTTESLFVSIIPEDGGSEADPQDIEMANGAFLNIWEFNTGSNTQDVLKASETISYSLSMSVDGELQDLKAGQTSGTSALTETSDPDVWLEAIEDDNGTIVLATFGGDLKVMAQDIRQEVQDRKNED